MRNHIKKLQSSLDVLFPLLTLLIGILVMYFATPVVLQAASPVPMPQAFLGEYSYDNETWYPLTDTAKLSALDGDLYLRGHWERAVPAKTRLNYFSNHIGMALYVDGQPYSIDLLLQLEQYGLELQPAICGRGWRSLYFEESIPADAQIQIQLRNLHTYGNEHAYRDFLSTLNCTPSVSEYLAKSLSEYSRPYLVVGIILIIAAIFLLGSALTGMILHAPVGMTVLQIGLLAGFAGGFFIFDTIGLTFWSENNILNTYGRHICGMYAVYMLGVVAKTSLQGRRRKLAGAALALCAIVNAAIIVLSLAGIVLIYNTLFIWVVMQRILCPILIYCCAAELFCEKTADKPTLLFLLLLFACVLLDTTGLLSSIYSSYTLTKGMLILFLACIFFRSMRNIILNYAASVRAQKLEKELEESRIAIMLSQIQPHFIFNVLGTIRGLCREDPEQAWKGLGDFSTYLRGNMNALANARSIPFSTELRHIETYLRLEKMRLGDKLNIVYDIQETDFLLPPLTLQPLVENAVKHGIFYKEGDGLVTIRSRREGRKIVISVHDDGVGFNAANPEPAFERHEHIGLINVQKRVEKVLKGTLQVDSILNEGTTVTLTFPLIDDTPEGV